MIDPLVATVDHCSGVPRLFRNGERHSLEVPPWDLWRLLGLGKLAGLPPSTEIRFFARAKCLLCFSHSLSAVSSSSASSSRKFIDRPCIRLLQSFLIILGPTGFPHGWIAIKQQLRSFAA